MPTFTYTARTRDGKKRKGAMSAESRQALVQALRAKGLTPDDIKEKAIAAGGAARRGRRVKQTEILIFTRQLATIVNAGLPLLQGLDILTDQTSDPGFGIILRTIAQDVEAGETFSESLAKHSRAFPPLFTSMVRAGEASGDLDGVLMRLADYLEATAELKRKIKSAMTYPVVALGFILLIASGLIIWVVPQFAEIFASFDAKLPAPTQILINISDFMGSIINLGIMTGAVIATVFAVRAYAATEAGRYNLDSLKLRAPVFGKILRKVAIARFTGTLSTLTRSGVAILGALEIVEKTAGNEVFSKAIREAADSVRGGETLAEPLARSGEFPSMVTRMIAIGEKTGALETMLQKICDFYDSEVKAAVEGLTSLIEPLLIVLMGIIVGGIVIALFLPILQLSSLIS